MEKAGNKLPNQISAFRKKFWVLGLGLLNSMKRSDQLSMKLVIVTLELSS